MKKLKLLALIYMFTLSWSVVRAEELTHEYQLDNGMRVIVKEDHRAPTVVHMVWYKAGSIDEVNGKTGVAHVLEHMMFKGTKNLQPGEFSKRVAALGGRENAFTSKDYTAYFQQIEKSHLAQVMALEAERMANLQIVPEEFAKEIQVVIEERRLRTDDQSRAIVYEQLIANALASSPYRNPIIGWLDDLNNMTYQDAQEWYQKWYAPNNAVLVVAGDVNPLEVLRLAKTYYGGLSPKVLPVRKPQQEIAQLGQKRISVKAPADNTDITLAWKVPKLENDQIDNREIYALAVLSAILDGYPSARLNRLLVKQKRIANSIDSSYGMNGRGPQLFMISATPVKGKKVEILEKEIKSVLDEVRKKGVTEHELALVKSQIKAAKIYKRDSIFGQAMEIGSSEMEGTSWKNLDRVLDNLQKVSSADIQAVIEKYLIDDRMTVAVLDPVPIDSTKKQATSHLQLRH